MTKVLDINSKETTIFLDQLIQISDLKEFAQTLLWGVAKEFEASQGAFFIVKKRPKKNILSFIVGYAYHIPESETIEYEFGEGLSGQVAKEGKLMNIDTVPEGYISIISGLGQASPSSIIIFPFKSENEVIAVIELASFKKIEKQQENYLKEISEKVEALLAKIVEGNK
jgi:transcriptional regulator with GAF, ATPase, and Fis domain